MLPLQKADSSSHTPIAVHHATVWNPTVQGTKSEDTFIVGERANELITTSAGWPAIEVPLSEGSATRPAVLALG